MRVRNAPDIPECSGLFGGLEAGVPAVRGGGPGRPRLSMRVEYRHPCSLSLPPGKSRHSGKTNGFFLRIRVFMDPECGGQFGIDESLGDRLVGQEHALFNQPGCSCSGAGLDRFDAGSILAD